MLFLYRLAILAFLPILLIRFVLRTIKNPDYRDRFHQRFGFGYPSVSQNGFLIHAVSVGEVNAAVPLVNKLKQLWPGEEITITTMTTTGAQRVQKLFGDEINHCYLPYDYTVSMGRFLSSIQPALVMVMETEIWPNMICLCARKNIPMLYTNVRMSERSYQGYSRFKALISQILPKISLFAVQGETDAKRLELLGAPRDNIAVTGSLKFDIAMPASVSEAGAAIRRQLGWNRPMAVAASTHEGEETLILDAFAKIRQELPETILVLVPRHPERFQSVIKECDKTSFRVLKRSNMEAMPPDGIDILVVDAMGELTMFIAASDITIMGGSLVPVGGHNLLEVASLAKPVVFGPHMFNFDEISQMFIEQGAGIQIDHVNQLADVMSKLLMDGGMRDQLGSKGSKLIEQNKGALDRVTSLIKGLYPSSDAAKPE